MSAAAPEFGAEARVVALFEAHAGREPARIEPLVPDGSARRYFRIFHPDGERLVGAYGPDPDENRAFLSFTRTFAELGLPVPRLHAADPERGVWLVDDLGDTTLFDLLAEARRRAAAGFPESVASVYERVVAMLPRFQVEGGRAIDFGVAYPRAAFDRQSILWDLNYFKYHFLKLAHVPFNEDRLERDFARLARFLLGAEREHFLYRDFQSRNVMVRDGAPWFIDYQGGRRGALQYDVASLLWDAKADLPESLRERLLARYLDALEERTEVDREAWLERYPAFVLVRIMQAMGAYGYRGFYERKPRFLQSVPYAARNIGLLIERGLPLRLPAIESAFRHIVEEWAPPPPEAAERDGLVVHVGSFSYRGGYPPDPGGHGGGFVFDCRALPNPGREEAYRTATGRHEDVVRWLRERPESEALWTRVRDLVEAQVQEYQRRGYTSLCVHFGCTGGQHRSVYMAERLAAHLRELFPAIEVRLSHRERAGWPPGDGSVSGEAAWRA